MFEVVYVGARGRLFVSFRDDGGNIFLCNIDVFCDVFDEFCVCMYVVCFLCFIDMVFKVLVDDGL